MRITGGTLKGYRIPARFASHVRPTTDMMREAIFNKLQHTTGIEGKAVLDLFSGSGIMSIEFISHGAASVVAVDKDTKNMSALKAIAMDKGLEELEMLREDVFRYLRNSSDVFDIIYADPPYDLPNMQELANLALELLAEGGLLFLEHRPGTLFTGPIKESRKHGSSAITIFAK